MKTVNLNKTWDRVVTEVHRIKPRHNNRIKREALFGLQILLSRYELAKNGKSGKLMKFCADVLEIYEKHDVNGHIVWKR